MPPFPPNTRLDPQTMRQILIAMMLQDMQAQQQQQQRAPSGPNVMRLIETLGGGSAGGAAANAGVGAGAGATGAGVVSLGSGGVATIPAGASVPAGYTAVGTAASGGTMVAPTASLGSSAGASSGTTAGAAGSYALPIAAAVVGLNNMWETGMKDIARGRGDRADWTNQAVNTLPVLGMAGTGGIANLGLRLAGKRSVGSMMKSGKSGAQRLRDDFRGDLKNAGLVDDDYMITLADGSKFNIGLDGGTRYQNLGENIDGKRERQAWDVDFSNPLAKLATDKLDPIIRNQYGADDKSKGYYPGQYTGMLVNAVTSNAKNEEDVARNIEAILSKGMGGEQAGAAQPQPIQRPGKGQVARVSPGMYINDQGRVSAALTSKDAMRQNYGNRIPRSRRR